MKSNNSKKYKYIRIIGIILFFYILSKINPQELFLTIKNINPFYFFLAIILLFISYVLAVLKWRLLVNSQDIKPSIRRLTEIFFKGLFLGTVTPGKLGEFWKAKCLTDTVNISGGRAFFTVLTDRLIDLIILIAVGIAGILNLFFINKIKTEWSITAFIILLSILIIFIIHFLFKKENTKKILKFSLKIFIPSFAKEKTDSFFDEFFEGLQQLNIVLFAKLLGYGFLYYLITVLVYYLLALSLGITITFFHLFLIAALISLVLLLPVTILGLGTRDASCVFFFGIFNVTASVAVVFSSLVLFAGIILSIPGMILFLKK